MSRFPAHPFSHDEVTALLAACGSGWVGARNRALFVTMWRGGLRCAEALGLRRDHLVWADRPRGAVILRVARPKGFARGAAPREVGLDPQSAQVLAGWLEVRGAGAGPLFWTRPGQQIQTSYVRRWMTTLGIRAGLERRCHAHALRHTFARELYDEGIGLVEIQLALGHTSLATTQTYLRSIGATEVIAATTGRVW